MTLWIVYQEWERGGDGGHAQISAVFSTEAAAQEYAAQLQSDLYIEGFNVYAYDPDDRGTDEADWEVNIHVDSAVLDEKPSIAAATTI